MNRYRHISWHYLLNSAGQIPLDKYACTDQVGCVLSLQQEDGSTKINRYLSRLSTDAKLGNEYNTTQRECIAIVRAVMLFCAYLEGFMFTNTGDHDSLKYILNNIDSGSRLARWFLRPPEFDVDVVHRAKIKPQEADALSSLPSNWENIIPFEDDLLFLALDTMQHLVDTHICLTNFNNAYTGPLSGYHIEVSLGKPLTESAILVNKHRERIVKQQYSNLVL